VRAKTTGVIRFRPINDDTQCEVTLVQHGDAGGFVPERVVVAKIPQALGGVGEMRELFQRDDAIDGAKRGELAAIIKCVSPARPPAPAPPPPLTPPPLPPRTVQHQQAAVPARREQAHQKCRREVCELACLREAQFPRPLRPHVLGLQGGQQQRDREGNDGTPHLPLPRERAKRA
jgi:hypothetical protein